MNRTMCIICGLCIILLIELNLSVTVPSVICQGSDVTLRCVILRNGQAVDLDWRRNGTLLDPSTDPNYKIIFNATFNANTDLKIIDVSLSDDNSQYTCSDTSSNSDSTVVLSVTGMFIIMHGCTVLQVTSVSRSKNNI